MTKKTVITIHGVNSTGGWQDRVDRVLSPHFLCLHRRYPDFPAPLGAIRACIGLRGTALAFFLTALVLWWLLNSAVWACLFAVFSAVMFGIPCAAYRRREVVKRFETWLGDATSGRPIPHLIAHSFGTYIVGNAIRRQPTVRLDTVILTGAVLPRTFPWIRVLDDAPRRLGHVRNEVGVQDWVSNVAGLLSWVTGMGRSGARGFQDSSHVHTIAGAWKRCADCSKESPVLVHNVTLDHFAHKDMFLSVGHVEELWLPLLWGIHPAEFDDFRRICETAADFEDKSDFGRLAIVEAELRERHWSWTALSDGTGASFEDLLEGFVWELLERVLEKNHVSLTSSRKEKIIGSIVGRAFRLIWQEFVHAMEETRKADPNLVKIKSLHPRIAMVSAVMSLLQPFA